MRSSTPEQIAADWNEGANLLPKQKATAVNLEVL